MTNDKKSSKTNHFLNKKKKKSSFIKNFYRILIVAILIATSYFFYNIFIKNPYIPFFEVFTINTDVEIPETIGDVNVETSLIVNGADYLEVTGVYINSDNPELSTVAAKLKNNSEQSYENVNLRITLLDKDNSEITSLFYEIDKIEANSDSSTFAALARDLFDCTKFKVTLIENIEQ